MSMTGKAANTFPGFPGAVGTLRFVVLFFRSQRFEISQSEM